MDPLLGTIQTFAFNYAPQGWSLCNGNLLSVNQNTALFSLLGVTFGGNGQTTFGVPNLGGRTVVGSGQSPGTSIYQYGQQGGAENVTLNTNNLPSHNHSLMGLNSNSTVGAPTNAVLAVPQGADQNNDPVSVTIYAPAGGSLSALSPSSIGATGSGSAFSVLQPYLALTRCIALQGQYPTRS